MFETIYRRSFTARLQQSAAFAESRSSYLDHLTKQGYARATVRAVARDIRGVAERLGPIAEKVDIATIELVVDHWMRERKCTARDVRIRIINAATSWLRFSGMLEERHTPKPFAEKVEQFTRYMTEERGLAPATICSNLKTIESFLSWFQDERATLADAVVTDIDRYLACKGREVWKRRTIARVAQILRLFFRNAEHNGWCRPGIAAGIDVPHIYGH